MAHLARMRTGLLTAIPLLVGALTLSPHHLLAAAEAAAEPTAFALASQGVSRMSVEPASAVSAERPGSPPSSYRVLPGTRLEEKPPAYLLPLGGYRLTGRFGASSSLWSSSHTGLDFAAPEGTSIRSVAAGEVISTGYDGAYGNKTAIRHDDGTVLWYAHQSAITVAVGQRVAAGEVIGHVGSTGNVTGPHLHLEVRPGEGDPVDPIAWLAAHGVHP